jgi:hypothetical protein
MTYTTHQSLPRSSAPLLQLLHLQLLHFFHDRLTLYEPEECLTVILTSEIGHGATGVVLRGRLEPDGAIPLDVVVKLAFKYEQRDALRSEYEIYRCLRSKGVLQGIATALGFLTTAKVLLVL